MKITALIAVLFLSGCTFLGPFKEILRDYESRAANSIVDSSDHLLCNAPLTTILNKYEGDRFFNWLTMCDHQMPGYRLVPIE